MIEDADVSLHPGMLIALYGDDLLTRKGLDDRIAFGRLRLVPLFVVLWQWMDVVRGLVRSRDLELLFGLQRHYVRFVLAAVLIEHNRIFRHIVAELGGGTIFDID